MPADVELYRRVRDRFDSDEKARQFVQHIILGRLKTWDVPSLYQVQTMEKANLVQVLYYCPESTYYYDDHYVADNMI